MSLVKDRSEAGIAQVEAGHCLSSSRLTLPSAQDVQVWQWDLDVHGRDFDRYWATLSMPERERADRFRFERHRRRFVAGRGELRRILGRYLGLRPEEVALGYGSDGKPFCTRQPASLPDGSNLCFNLSHSGNAAALAIANGFEVGIDVEQVRPLDDSVPLEVFSARERAAFRALRESERQAVFFESWTRKEACLKALGTGFILPPTHFEFDLAIHGDTTPHRVGGAAEEAAHWRVRSLPCGPACVGAIAARRTDWSIANMH